MAQKTSKISEFSKDQNNSFGRRVSAITFYVFATLTFFKSQLILQRGFNCLFQGKLKFPGGGSKFFELGGGGGGGGPNSYSYRNL